MLAVRDFLADQRVLRSERAPGSPRVSVILPTHARHRSGQLERAIASVLTQEPGDLELLVIDDGSTDGTADLVDGLRARDPRVVHVRHERNGGLHSVRLNEGIELARGRWLAFQFDDDAWRPGALKALTGALEGLDAPAVVVGHAEFHGPGSSWILPAGELNAVTLHESNRLANHGVLVPRELMDRHGMYDCHLGMRRLCDWDLWLRLILRVPFVLVDAVIGDVYEGNPGSLGRTVPWDLSLFRYLHAIPRNHLLTPSAWRGYEVDALRIGEVDVAGDFRRRLYADHVLPHYLTFRSSFPAIEGFRPWPPERPRTVLYAKGAYDVSNEVTLNHHDRLAGRPRALGGHFQIPAQVEPGWTREADGLLLVRVVEAEGLALARQAIEAGRPLGYAMDDDLLTFHELGPGFAYLAPGTPAHANVVTLLGQADAVWVTNRFIAGSAGAHARRVIPYGVCVPAAWLPGEIRPRRPAEPFRIGYAGTGYRREEFAVIWEALERVSRRYRDRLRFEFWGLDVSGLPPLDSPVGQRPFTFGYFEYLARLREARLDLFLCPLLDRPRPRLGKSPIKYLEAAVAGALGIFSDVPQYAGLRDGVTCLKATNDVASWQAALERALAMPPDDLDRLRRQCLRHVREEHTDRALIDRHEAAWRATELHARTRAARHPDGRPRVVYVLHSAIFGGGELQLWRRLRLARAYGIEPVVVIPRHFMDSDDAARIAADLAGEGIALEFVGYPALNEFPPRARPRAGAERAEARKALRRLRPALVHTVTFIPSFGEACRDLGIPHVASLYAIEDAVEAPAADPRSPHCTVVQSDTIRYAARWAHLLGRESLCAREVAPEDYFRLGFERSLRGDTPPGRSGPWRIAMSGTLQPRKGQAEAIEAVGRLREAGLDCRLDLHGYTHYFPDYHRQCQELVARWILDDRVVFHGFSAAGAKVLEDADILLCASTFESFPSSIKEALAAGVLVVTTSAGGIPELIVDGVTGILCAGTDSAAVADGLRRACALSPGESARIVENARRVARVELHPDRAANDLMTLYLKALDLHDPAGAAEGARPGAGRTLAPRAQRVGRPPLDHVSLARERRYLVIPARPRWSGIRVKLGTTLADTPVRGRLRFEIRREGGAPLRHGTVGFVARGGAGRWRTLGFPELENSAGVPFVVSIRLADPAAAGVRLFEPRHRRPLLERLALTLGLPHVRPFAYARLLYAP